MSLRRSRRVTGVSSLRSAYPSRRSACSIRSWDAISATPWPLAGRRRGAWSVAWPRSAARLESAHRETGRLVGRAPGSLPDRARAKQRHCGDPVWRSFAWAHSSHDAGTANPAIFASCPLQRRPQSRPETAGSRKVRFRGPRLLARATARRSLQRRYSSPTSRGEQRSSSASPDRPSAPL
jgi:hypothetical protein